MKIKPYFLILSGAGVSMIALLYGLSPQWFARTFLGIAELNVNMAHILRAVTGLYLALSAFWLFSAYHEKYRNTAILTVIIFSAGLVLGRIVSFFADGQPAPLLLIYIAMELIFAPAAYWVFKLPD